jgi:hypothetical protein
MVFKPLLTNDNPKNMFKSTASALILSVSLFVGLSGTAKAADIIVTPTFDISNQAASPDTTDYEGSFFDGSAGPYDLTIGKFTFSIPTGDNVIGGTISGTFGDQNIPVSSLADLFVDGIEVGECDSDTAPCAAGALNGLPVAWSYTFDAADLNNLDSALSSGSLDFTAVQNGFGSLFVGTPSLDLQVAPVPEPASIFTLAGGILAIAAWRRRK